MMKQTSPTICDGITSVCGEVFVVIRNNLILLGYFRTAGKYRSVGKLYLTHIFVDYFLLSAIVDTCCL